MDEGTERPGLFAKGGVGRFLLGLTVGALIVSVVVCGLPIVIGTAVIGAGTGHYVTTHMDEFETHSDEGTAFAEGRTITECVEEARRRAAGCTDLAPSCALPIGLFAGACTRAADDDGYCTAVPARSEALASTQWKKTKCAAAPTIWCEAVMGMVQSGCEERTKTESTGDGNTDDASDPD